jgi:hypothetical protein
VVECRRGNAKFAIGVLAHREPIAIGDMRQHKEALHGAHKIGLKQEWSAQPLRIRRSISSSRCMTTLALIATHTLPHVPQVIGWFERHWIFAEVEIELAVRGGQNFDRLAD